MTKRSNAVAVSPFIFTLAIVLIATALLAVGFQQFHMTYLGTLNHKVASLHDKLDENREKLLALKAERDLYANTLSIAKLLQESRISIPGTKRTQLAYTITKSAQTHGIDPFLVLALIKTESSFRNSAVSVKGAQGLMQLLPETAVYVAQISDDISMRHAESLHNPILNIEVGVQYLAYLTKTLKNERLAIIAYNAGPNAIQNKKARGERLPSGYYRKVMNNYNHLVTRAKNI